MFVFETVTSGLKEIRKSLRTLVLILQCI